MSEGPPVPEQPEPACPRCGAPYNANQEYCLECGLRLGGPRGRMRALESAWRERFGFYPGDWVWPALLGLVIAVAGATAAILLGASNGGGGNALPGTTPTGTVHAPTTPPATATVLPTVPSGTPTATTPPTQTAPPRTTSTPPGGAGTLTAWPGTRNGFTVVLESVPTSAGRSFAVARAQAAARSGLPRVGVLNSGRFSSLHPGYFVVFSGVYGTRSEADRARITASGRGYPAAYAREIRP